MSDFRFYVCILTLLGSSVAWSAFSSNPSKPSGAITVPQAAAPMSAADFKSNVTTVGDQNKAQLNQQVTNLLPKAPPTPYIAPAPKPTTTSTSPTTTTETTSQDEPTYPAQETRTPAQPVVQQPPAQPVYTTPAQQPAQPRTPAYTGFTGGATAPSKAPGTAPAGGNTKPSSTSGGWNIKY